MSKNCVVCGSDCKIIEVEEKFIHKGVELSVPDVRYYQCSSCYEEFVDHVLDKRNSLLIQAKKSQAEGRRTPQEIRSLRKRFNLSQAAAAKVFGGGANAFSKYERGEVAQSAAMDKLMSVAEEVPGVIEKLCEKESVSYSPSPAHEFRATLSGISNFYITWSDNVGNETKARSFWNRSQLVKASLSYLDIKKYVHVEEAAAIVSEQQMLYQAKILEDLISHHKLPLKVKEVDSEEVAYCREFGSEAELRH